TASVHTQNPTTSAVAPSNSSVTIVAPEPLHQDLVVVPSSTNSESKTRSPSDMSLTDISKPDSSVNIAACNTFCLEEKQMNTVIDDSISSILSMSSSTSGSKISNSMSAQSLKFKGHTASTFLDPANISDVSVDEILKHPVLRVSQVEDSDFIILETLKSALYPMMAQMFINIPIDTLKQLPDYDYIKHMKITNAFSKINKLMDKSVENRFKFENNEEPPMAEPKHTIRNHEKNKNLTDVKHICMSPNDKHYSRLSDGCEDSLMIYYESERDSRTKVVCPESKQNTNHGSSSKPVFSFKTVNKGSAASSGTPITGKDSTTVKKLFVNKKTESVQQNNVDRPISTSFGDCFLEVSLPQKTSVMCLSSPMIAPVPLKSRLSNDSVMCTSTPDRGNMMKVGRGSPIITSSAYKKPYQK
ncbi:hypothetical protein SK128_026985, partial [Halocaridina rubra]